MTSLVVGGYAQNADLSVSIATSPDHPVLGQSLTYILSVENFGPDMASNVILDYTLPPGAVFSSASPACSHDPMTRVCQWMVGDINNGSTAVLEVRVDVTYPESGGHIDIFFTATADS